MSTAIGQKIEFNLTHFTEYAYNPESKNYDVQLFDIVKTSEDVSGSAVLFTKRNVLDVKSKAFEAKFEIDDAETVEESKIKIDCSEGLASYTVYIDKSSKTIDIRKVEFGTVARIVFDFEYK
ncbi:MAG: hypothetical protein CL868_19495 [Cytophagaceae bacterium]|nr:hypothetical protein [Cytophagaceae bacterium]|tara:strand:- start:51 stop:416 length:366 start_codon:yes stop_codon:yes gene_type:complete